MQHPNPEIETLLARLATPDLPLVDLSLDRIRNFLDSIGHPQDNLPPVIHVAGTNGKGSLLAYLKSIMEAAGLKVHRLTSPYLVTFNEEIAIAGADIKDNYLADLLKRVLQQSQKYPLTFFEASTVMAFIAFAEYPADGVLLETGLGGRLDSTNVITAPALTVIMPVSLDHAEFLGDTVAAIAGEKAGIIKHGVPCVVAKQSPEALQVIAAKAKASNAPLYGFGSEWTVDETAQGFHYRSLIRDAAFPLPNLAGNHQIYNAAAAIACVDKLPDFRISNEHIAAGITHAVWQARLQHLEKGNLVNLLPRDSELWLDGGHNAGAGEVLADWLGRQKKPVHVISGILQNKEADKIIAAFAPLIASFTAIPVPDEKKISYPPQLLAAMAGKAGIKNGTAADVKSAINAICRREQGDIIILICGSLYLAGNVLWQNQNV